MFVHETKVRVRYGETDKMGYCYYGNYAQFFEVGRVEALRALGVPYKDMENFGIMLPVREYNVQYYKPAFYDDLVTIKTSIKSLPSTKFRFDYETFNEKGEKLNEAHTTLIFVDMKTGKPTRPVSEVLEALAPYF